MAGVKNDLREDLRRAEALAFAGVAGSREFIERCHDLPGQVKQHRDFELVEKIYEWMFVPLSLWPVDVRGLGLHVIGCIQEGRELDAGARLMGRLLTEAPADTVCEPIAEYEHAVKAGNYEGLIEAQAKFDSLERELQENPELKGQ